MFRWLLRQATSVFRFVPVYLPPFHPADPRSLALKCLREIQSTRYILGPASSCRSSAASRSDDSSHHRRRPFSSMLMVAVAPRNSRLQVVDVALTLGARRTVRNLTRLCNLRFLFRRAPACRFICLVACPAVLAQRVVFSVIASRPRGLYIRRDMVTVRSCESLADSSATLTHDCDDSNLGINAAILQFLHLVSFFFRFRFRFVCFFSSKKSEYGFGPVIQLCYVMLC